MGDIASLVADAPPGEIDAVQRDIEIFSGNSSAIKRKVEIAIAKANVEQYRVAEVDGKLTVLSKYNQLEDDVFFTHGASPIKFSVNMLTRKTKSEGKYTIDDDIVGELKSAQKAVDKYAQQHYAGEYVSAVFPTDNGLAIVIVGRKLSPENFHNGQITAVYTLQDNKLRGKISADVHLFEDGNVRLKSSLPITANTEVGLAEVLEKVENDYEQGLNKALVGLNENEFKNLRRQLPVARQPMQWGKAVFGYKLGKELENR